MANSKSQEKGANYDRRKIGNPLYAQCPWQKHLTPEDVRAWRRQTESFSPYDGFPLDMQIQRLRD